MLNDKQQYELDGEDALTWLDNDTISVSCASDTSTIFNTFEHIRTDSEDSCIHSGLRGDRFRAGTDNGSISIHIYIEHLLSR